MAQGYRGNYRRSGSSRSYGRATSRSRSYQPRRRSSGGGYRRRSTARTASRSVGKQVVEVRLVTEAVNDSPGARNLRVLSKMNPPRSEEHTSELQSLMRI